MEFRSATRPRTLTKKKATGGCCGIIAVIVFIALVASIFNGHGSAQQAASTSTATSASVLAASTPTAATVKPTVKVTIAPKATPTAQPTHQSTPRPTPTHPACQGVNNNPWCYSFSGSTLIYTPPNGFCNYFNCIPTFYASDDPGDGYIVQCVDGMFSQSGSERGACSSHGGVSRPLYSH